METPSFEKEQPVPISPREARRDAVWMGELVEESVPELLRSYQSAGGSNNRNAHNMPSKRAVGRICEDLLQLLFPGFHDSEAVHEGSLDELTASRLAGVITRLTEWAHSRTGIDIHPGASIGTHFFIDHGTGVVIGETCNLGNNVKLYHGVTLGARSFVKDDAGHIVKGGKRHPDVEDNVTIYPNSTILGGETVIGANSTIGANVFLMQSVPANSLVVYEEKQLVIRDKAAKKKAADYDYVI